jgi:AcrR family transcriptional regulator
MENRKTDRRVQRTRQALLDAMLELMREKGYEALTVEEITARANLGRTTFYLHYRDKEDLLLERFRALQDELVRQVDQVPLATWRVQLQNKEGSHLPVRPFLLLFEHAAEHADFYRLVFRSQGASDVEARLRALIAHGAEALRQLKSREGLQLTDEVPFEVFTHYYAGALLGLLAWWLEQDTPYSPDEMALMFQRLLLPGVRQMLGIE